MGDFLKSINPLDLNGLDGLIDWVGGADWVMVFFFNHFLPKSAFFRRRVRMHESLSLLSKKTPPPGFGDTPSPSP